MGNALLSGVTPAQLSLLQRVQNCAAGLVTRTNRAEHITPVLNNFTGCPWSSMSSSRSCCRSTALAATQPLDTSVNCCMRALRLDQWGPTPKVCSWLSQKEPAQPGETAALPRLVPSCGMPCQSTSGRLTRSPFSKRHWKHTFSPQPSNVTNK